MPQSADLIRWIPFSCVLAAGWLLLSFSNPRADLAQEKETEKLELPVPPKEYVVPADLHNPFVSATDTRTFEERLQAKYELARKQAADRKAKELAAQQDAAKKSALAKRETIKGNPKVRKQGGVTLNGILWDPNHPLASINGRTLPEGGKLGDISVIKIFPDRVILRVKGKQMEKRLDSLEDNTPPPQGRKHPTADKVDEENH